MEADGNSRKVRDGMLSVRVSAASAGLTIALSGELDMANAATLAAELERAEGETSETITVDLEALEFIDSTGIAVIVAAHQRLNADGTRFRLIRSRASGVQRVMEVTGLHRELPFAP